MAAELGLDESRVMKASGVAPADITDNESLLAVREFKKQAKAAAKAAR